MKKYLNLTLFWMINALSGLFVSSVAITETDPSDELSFSLNQAGSGSSYRLISKETMTTVLKKRLDMFPKSQVPRFVEHMRSLCVKYRFDPAFILGVMEVESGFHVNAASEKGAVGLMQVMVPTADFVVQRLGLTFTGYEGFTKEELRKKQLTSKILADPFLNISVGIGYLAWLREHYKSRTSAYYMLAAYNMGPGRMNQLLVRKDFKPTGTKKYFLTIREATLKYRFYTPADFRRPAQLTL